MNTPTEDIKAILEDQMSPAPTIYIGQEQLTPVELVTLYDTGGYPRHSRLEKGKAYSHLTIQVRVRSAAYNGAFEVINSICSVLHNSGPVDNEDFTFEYTFLQRDEPMFLKYDTKGSAIWVVNFTVQRVEIQS